MKLVRKVRVDSSVTSPSPGKISGEYRMYASGAVICRALQKLSTPRKLCWAMAVPICPTDAPITAAGIWAKELLPQGREAQSIAFFSAPGIERLYSGVTNKIASEAAIAAFRARA